MNKGIGDAVRACEEGVYFMNENEHVCGNYDDDDTVCRTCTDNRVQRQQSCYVPGCVKPGKANVENSSVDKVHPDHYKLDNGREVIDVIRLMMTDDEVRGFCKGNYLKYMLRAGKKAGESAETDRSKAAWYLDYLENMDDDVKYGFDSMSFKYLDSAEKIEYRGHGVDKYVD